MTSLLKITAVASLGVTLAVAMSDADARQTSQMLEEQEKESLRIIRSKHQPAKTAVASTPQAAKTVPSWYLNFGLGVSQLAYEASMQNSIELASSLNANHMGVAIDMGIYGTLGRFLVGYAIMGNAAQYAHDTSYSLATGGLSTIVFPFSASHEGLYARVDLSAAAFRGSVQGALEHNQTGVGAVLGVGYRTGVWNFALNAMATEFETIGTNYAYNGMISIMW